MNMLVHVTVKRFKSLDESTVLLAPMTALVGPNNAGKSSVLQAVQFATSVCQSLQIDNSSSWRHGGRVGTLSTQQLIYTPLRDLNALARGGFLRQDAESAIEVTLVDDALGSVTISVRRGRNKNISIAIEGETLGRQLEDLQKPFSVFAPGLAGIPSVEEYRAPGIVRRAAARGDANSVFRNVLWTLYQEPIKWEAFITSLQHVFPDVDISIQFDQSTDEHIDVALSREGVSLPVDSAGTGVLQAIQVLSYVGVYSPKLLLLDEPDSHLHPDNQRKLVRLLSALTAGGGLQVLMSTHSRHFLDELRLHGSQMHWLSSGTIHEGTFSQVSALLELGALDAGDRLRGGKTAVIVLTEDSLTANLKTLLTSSGLKEKDFAIWPYNGCTELKSAVVLADFIREHAPGTRVMVHRDRDYLGDSVVQKLQSSLAASSIELFITEGTDIESHFLGVDYLRELYPEHSEVELKALLDEATEDLKEYSCETMITKRVEAANEERRSGGPVVNPGRISTQARSDFEENPKKYRHGKKTLKRLRTIMQERGAAQRGIGVLPSNHLAVPVIKSIADSLS